MERVATLQEAYRDPTESDEQRIAGEADKA
jgi:hypothetical protein